MLENRYFRQPSSSPYIKGIISSHNFSKNILMDNTLKILVENMKPYWFFRGTNQILVVNGVTEDLQDLQFVGYNEIQNKEKFYFFSHDNLKGEKSLFRQVGNKGEIVKINLPEKILNISNSKNNIIVFTKNGYI